VKSGDFLSLVLRNGFQFFETCVAAWKLGATPFPISYQLAAAERLALLDLVNPPLVVGLPSDAVAGRQTLPVGYEPKSLDDTALPDAVSKPFIALGSGGSTGRPKIVLMDAPGLLNSTASDIDASRAAYGLNEDMTMLIPGPLYHAGPGLLSIFTILAGGHLVTCEKFDPVETLALVERHKATAMFLVPTMMVRISKLDEAVRNRFDMSSLKIMYHAAAPCPPWVKEQWIHWIGGHRIHESFGASDGAAVCVIMGDEWLERRGSVGRPVVGEVGIFDENFKRCPPGEIGEIFMRSPSGGAYVRRYIGAPPAKTREDGWKSVGDMGHVDADGYLYLADRRVDMIISGGVNIYPAEIEAALEEHPDVACAVVVGVPDEDLGKRVHAIVQINGEVKEDELRAFLRERISRIKVPKSFDFTSRPLRDEAGKVRRIALAEEAARKFAPLGRHP
jgi:bile acid-coenzyme A ligase